MSDNRQAPVVTAIAVTGVDGRIGEHDHALIRSSCQLAALICGLKQVRRGVSGCLPRAKALLSEALRRLAQDIEDANKLVAAKVFAHPIG